MTVDMMDALYGQAQQDTLHLLSKVPPTLSVHEGVGILSFEAISLSTFEAGKKIPSKYRWEGKNLRFMITDAALSYVKRTWTNVIVLKPMIPKAEQPKPEIIEVAGTLPWKPRKQPMDHQRRAFELGAPQEEFAYLYDRGCGKSKSAIDDAAFHFARGEIDRVVVVAPNGVHEQWVDVGSAEHPGALEAHWPLQLGCVRWAIQTGDVYQEKGVMKKRRPEWMHSGNEKDCKWLAVNSENISVREVRESGRRTWALDGLSEEVEAFLKAGPAMLIWDESHKGKNPAAKLTLAMWKLGKSAKYRRILTGSPIAKGIEDYYAQFRFLNPNILGIWSFAGFKQQFCVMGGFQGKQITGYRDTEEFHKRIASVSYRVEKDDVLDLPPKMYLERLVTLTPAQRKVYNELKLELETVLSDGSTLQAGEIVQRMLRLQQVTQGFLPLEDGGYDEFAEGRIQAVRDIIAEVSGRVVIWSRFTRDVEKLIAEFGDEAIRYDGHDKHLRPQSKRDWLTPGSRKRFFIGNAQAGGTGLDWINGPQTVIYYSNSFSSIDRWQSEDRTHRMGTKGCVTYYDIICKGTLDRAILRNLQRKRDISDMSLEELKQIVAEL